MLLESRNRIEELIVKDLQENDVPIFTQKDGIIYYGAGRNAVKNAREFAEGEVEI